MKLWFETCHNFTTDSDCPVQLGLHWYKHVCTTNNKFKSWRGFSIVCHFFKWSITFNAVDDFKAYDYRMNYRWMRK
jgi:hypothetical protein